MPSSTDPPPAVTAGPTDLAAVLEAVERLAAGSVASVLPPADDTAPDSAEARLLRAVRDLVARAQRAEQQAGDLAERYDLVMRGADDGLWDWDLRTNEIYFSPRWKQILGYADHEIPNDVDQWRSRMHPDDLDRAFEAVRAHILGETDTYEFEHRLRHRDGTYRWISARGAALRDANGRAYRFAGAHWDITERRLAGERLREQEQQYRAIFEATTDGLVICDIDTGRIVAANPAACRMYGYEPGQLIGLHPTAFIHPSQHHAFDEFLATVRSGGEMRRRALNVRKDGTPLHIEVRGSVFSYMGRPHLLGILRDVTDSVESFQRLEQRVEERTRELSTLLDVSHNVASTLELEPLLEVILDQLKTVADYAGAAIVVLDGDRLRMIKRRAPPPDEHLLTRQIEVPLDQARVVWEMMCRREPAIVADVRGDAPLAQAYRRTMGGSLEETALHYIRSWMAVPLALADRVIGMITISQAESDFYTARHAMLATAIANQAAVAIENARLYAQAQKLAALEERQRLARDLHDSVTQSVFSLGMLARAAQTQHARGAAALGPTLQRIGALAGEALAEMRALLLELHPTTLAEEGLQKALDRLVASFRVRTDIALTLTAETDVRPGAEAAGTVYRIVQEALSNAIKHAGASAIAVRLLERDRGLVLTVTDDGAGFDPAAPEGRQGGMGLRSMRERATAAGMALTITSTPGRGTTVTLAVPLGPTVQGSSDAPAWAREASQPSRT